MSEHNKYYYCLTLTQTAPLRISSGENDTTDSDLMKDSLGLPFIPGSSLAGVLRSMLPAAAGRALFGELDPDGEPDESRVLVSDAVLPAGTTAAQVQMDTRDGVGLNDRGTAKNGAKYDFEVVQTSLPYTAVLEYTGAQPSAELEALLQTVAAHGMAIGARTTRGYGHMQAAVRRLAFAMPQALEQWLAFDPFATNAFAAAAPLEGGTAQAQGVTIRAQLAVEGSFSVRVYTSGITESGTAPDYCPLQNATGQPVVPGTSWAGSFRHHMRGLLGQLGGDAAELDALDALFGVLPQGKDSQRSRVAFSETAITGGESLTVTRNAVERFTGAPRNTGLYTAQVCQGGTGVLEIRLPAGLPNPLHRQLLAAALVDLDLGLLTFGGEGNIGRGRVQITALTVNGRDCTQQLKQRELDWIPAEVQDERTLD